MGIDMASKPKQSFFKYWSFLAILALPTVSLPTLAEEILCDAIQVSADELPLLDQTCPIGKGLWGKSKPVGQESTFWIQCGVFSQPFSVAQAKKIYPHITTDVWNKPEAKVYRCLIGPYKDFTTARQDLDKVQKQSGYQQSFIREIVKGASAKKPSATPKTPPSKPKPVVSELSQGKGQATTVIPAPAKAQPAVVPQPKATNEPAEDKSITVRRSASIAGVEYVVPYWMLKDEQFYMEHEIPWNRLDYEGAYKTCYRMKMRMATASEWQALLDSNVMTKDEWPVHLPYWGAEKTGLFSSGKVNQLKGTSLLNVVCVK